MNKFFEHLPIDRKLISQFLLVFTAFFVMVLLSSIFGAKIVNKNVASYGNEALDSSAETIDAYLKEYQVSLSNVAFTVERLKNKGASLEEIHEEMVQWTNWMLDGSNEYEFAISVYGYVDDKFLDGALWEPPADYVPQSRPWYIGALTANGEVFYTNPYVDARTGQNCITVSKLVFDENGQSFGILAIDAYITGITNYVDNLRIMDSGYGILLNSEREIIVHPDRSLVGRHWEDINNGEGGYTEMASLLAIGHSLSAYPFIGINGEKEVAFFKKVDTGLYVGIASPGSDYNNDVYLMIALLSAAGLVLMTLLCAVLAILHAEKARSDEANKVKTSFLANMSHEIRTPMNAIIGMTELLLNEPLNERQKGCVNDINTSSHSLLGIINDILDLSKIEAGKLMLSPVHYDFHDFIENIRSMFRFAAEKKGLKFIFETDGELPKYLYGDEIRLRQALANICGNAVKFTSEGYIHIKVSASEQSVIFEIEDTGTGIKKEDMGNIFSAFAHANSGKGHTVKGHGLGLAISKSFIDMMGGQILVNSVFGEGSLFTVIIPNVPGDEKSINRGDDNAASNHFAAPSAKILVVDDNKVNLKVASGLLNLYKINAKTVLSGREALSLIKEVDYDIVFMDHMMPDMDGIETTAEIRKMGGKYKNLTVIALTANAIAGAKEIFLSNGFNDFIAKPIEMEILEELLRKWLPPEKMEYRENQEESNDTN